MYSSRMQRKRPASIPGHEPQSKWVDRHSAAISRLPLELLLEILRYVDLADYFNLKRTDRWLYKMLHDIPPNPEMLRPWLTRVEPLNLISNAQLIQSYQNLQFKVTDVPINHKISKFRMSGTIASWRLDDRTYVLKDFATHKTRTLHFSDKVTARELTASRAVIATADQTIHIFLDPFNPESQPQTLAMTSAVGWLGELGIAGTSTIILRDRANALWHIDSALNPIRLEDVNYHWDLVLLNMEGTSLYLLRNEGRRGISYESVCLATKAITRHPAQTVGTIQGDEETHGWIDRHSKLWMPNQPIYFIHSACPAGERLQIIRFNPTAPNGNNFVTECFYEHRIRSFCCFGPLLLYDHYGKGAKERGLMMQNLLTGEKRRFLGERDARDCDLRISEGGNFVYWKKSQRRMSVLCFNRDIEV